MLITSWLQNYVRSMTVTLCFLAISLATSTRFTEELLKAFTRVLQLGRPFWRTWSFCLSHSTSMVRRQVIRFALWVCTTSSVHGSSPRANPRWYHSGVTSVVSHTRSCKCASSIAKRRMAIISIRKYDYNGLELIDMCILGSNMYKNANEVQTYGRTVHLVTGDHINLWK